MPAAPLTLAEAAAHFRVSRRFFQEFIQTNPFYRMMGRRKLFFEDDIARITEALKRPRQSISARRAPAKCRPTAPTSESALNELRALLKKSSP